MEVNFTSLLSGEKNAYPLILFLDAAHKKIIWLTDKLFHVKH